MRVAVTGATGVLGQEAIEALVAAGHEVTGVTRRERGIPIVEGRGASAVVVDVHSTADLSRAFRGHDAVINALGNRPVGRAVFSPLAWREDDRLHQVVSGRIAEAAADAGVHRLIQESTAFLYPDHGEEWIGEDLALDAKNQAFRPRIREMRAAADFARNGRTAVILRLGKLFGRDPDTTSMLRAVRDGDAVLMGRPSHYIPLLHHDDAGRAFVAALRATSGFYNVAGEPITRRRWSKDLGAEAGAPGPAKFIPEVAQAVMGTRLETERRSLRVSSLRFMTETGWRPRVGPSTRGWSRL